MEATARTWSRLWTLLVVLYFIGTVESQNITFSCFDDTWTKKALGTQCYKAFDAKLEFWDASHFCHAYGGYLADSQNEVDIKYVGELAMAAGLTSYWSGLFYKNGMAYLDQDSSTVVPQEQYYWYHLQPPATADLMGSEWFQTTKVVDAASFYSYPFATSWESGRLRQGFVCERAACLTDQITCLSGDCVTGTACDGSAQCNDVTDELKCDANCHYWQEGDSGTVESGTYEDNANCRWTLVTTPDKRIKLEFSAFNTEQNLDQVEIWIGGPTQASATLFTRLSGTTVPSAPIYSTNNFLIVIFTSDNSGTASGFTAAWTAEELVGVTPEELMVGSSPAEIMSPGYPTSLQSNLRMTWILTVRQRKVITLQVEELNLLGNEGSFLEVRDGREAAGVVLAELKPGANNPAYVMSVSSSMRVYMHTEAAIEGGNFKLKYWEGCKIQMNVSRGAIISPGYSLLDYPNFLDCSWTITSPTGDGFKAVANTDFGLEDGKDFLSIYDGVNSTGTALLDKATGTSLATTEFHSAAGNLHFVFTTNAATRGKGFSISFSIDCPALGLSNWTITDPDPYTISLNDEVTLSCMDGYEFGQQEHYGQSSVKITCTNTGWDVTQIPNCQPKCCGQPPKINQGYVESSTGVSYTETATYKCYTGLGVSGTGMITCQADGTWEAAPTCQEMTCTQISELEQGSVSTAGMDGTRQGDILTFTCNTGYDLMGAGQVLCNAGQWSAPTPICEPLKCPLPDITNAQFIPEIVDLDATTLVTCASGYDLVDSTNTIKDEVTLTCGMDQNFQEVLPRCNDTDECLDPMTCAPPAICSNTDGSFQCSCPAGWKEDPNNPNACTDILECEITPPLCSGNCTEMDGSYQCDCNPDVLGKGYVLYDQPGAQNFSLATGETGLLVGDVRYINHTCVPRQCPDLVPLTNGVIMSSKEHFHSGDVVYFDCDLGYVLNGDEMITCGGSDLNGVWVNAPPTCEVAVCTVPDLTANQFPPAASDSTANYGENVTFTCAMHQETPIAYSRQCVFVGDAPNRGTYGFLIDDIKNCQVIDCGTPVDVGGASVTQAATDNFLDDKYKIQCASGFTLTGNNSLNMYNPTTNEATITCLPSGYWDLGSLTCSGAQCPDPGTPLGGYQILDVSYEIGRDLEFACNRSGYTPNGGNLTCELDTSNVVWNGNAPTLCEDTEPPVFENCPSEELFVDKLTAPGFPTPNATDNTGVKTLVTDVATFDPSHIITASVTVTYTATDFNNNQATCVVKITVRNDQEKPVITCPSSYEYELSDAAGGMVDYTANAATAVDGAVNLEVTYDPPVLNITVDDIGSFYVVTASAKDADGYEDSCKFMIKVKVVPCMDWALPAPQGGTKTCTANGSGGFSCIMQCDSDGRTPYFLYDHIAGSAATQLVYTCTAGAAWDRGDNVPACIAPVNAEYTLGGIYPYSSQGGVSVDFAACKSVYEASLNTLITAATTALSNFCNSNYIAEDGSTPNYVVQLTSVISLTSPTTFGVHIVYGVGPDTLSTATIRSCGDSYITFALRPAFNTHLRDLSTIAGDASCATLELSLGTSDQELNSPTPGFNCDAEFSKGAFDNIDYCVPCPTGSYYNSTENKCLLCAKGSYQDMTGQMSCTMCPAGTDTYGEGAAALSECIDQCSSFNMTSATGLPPCNQCPRDKYTMDAMTCANCPANTAYPATGAGAMSDCMAQCQAGSYSDTGFEMCIPCPTGYYQANPQTTTCEECAKTETNTDQTVAASCAPADTLCTSYCSNGGTCTIVNHLPQCACDAGYTGSTCDTQINYCESNPCYVGTCMQQVNGYVCQCPAGWTGDHCENDPDDCAGVTCPNAGQCYDHFDTEDHTCICPEGFTGPACAGDDVCIPNQCVHGSCNALGSVRFTCSCDGGWVGQLCNTDIDECLSKPCLYGGTCQNLENGYNCMCPDDFTGTNCEVRPTDVCGAGECSNSGVCVDDIHANSYYCICAQGYRRDITDSPTTWLRDIADVNTKDCLLIDFCDPDPCVNGGACVPMTNDYRCDCQNGYSGKNCQHNTDDCASDPCQNGGKCVDGLTRFDCECATGYQGTLCDENINECDPFPCFVEGTNPNAGGSTRGCFNLIGDYSCACIDGFQGKNCSDNIDDCVRQPCLHGSKCVDGVDSFTCECAEGWQGMLCDDPVDQCTVNYCENGGTCFSVFDHYYCACTDTYFGQNCTLQASVCREVNPCIGDGSTCTESADGDATCECSLANTGDCCHISKDFCAGDGVCVWGSCTASGGGFNCACYDDFEGEFCDASMDDCASVSCANGGECVDAVNTYYCECPIGKSGIDCDKDLVESYDIYCFSSAKDNLAYLAYPFVLNSTDWTLSVWVKYSTNGGTGTFLTFYGLKNRYIVSPKTELLRIDDTGVHAKFGGAEATAVYVDERGGTYRINDGRWINVVLTYDFNMKELTIYLNAVKTGTITSYGGVSAMPEFGYIELGTYKNATTGQPIGFNGHISRLSVWNRVLQRSPDISNLGNLAMDIDNTGRILTWANFLTGFGCTFVPESTAEIIAQPPQPPAATITLVCPADQYVVATKRDMQVMWTVPSVQGSSVTPVALHASGNLFTYGVTENAYVARAEDGTLVVCYFSINVKYGNCPDPVLHPTKSSPLSCTTGDNYKSCAAVCPSNNAITVDHPTAYTCGKLGSFNLRKPYTQFRIPACGALAGSGGNSVRTVRIVIVVTYPNVDNCNNALAVGGVTAAVRSNLMRLNAMWKNSQGMPAFCPTNDCATDVTIITMCGSSGNSGRRRRKRQTEDMGLEMTIPTVENPVLDTANNPADPQDVLNLAIFDNDLLDPGDSVATSPDLDNLVMDINPICQPGQIVTSNQECVTCAAGSYHDESTNQCIPCDYGKFQETEGQTSCMDCDAGLTTGNLNSVSATECKASCAAGSMNDGSACILCPVGFYQPEAGQFFCHPCGATKTTSGEGTVAESSCLDACVQGGTELAADGLCVDCKIGFYRQVGVDNNCVPCPLGFVTPTTKSTNAMQCDVPACMPGHRTNDNNDGCVECAIGKYQPEKYQATCIDCSENTTTVATGSVNMTQCLKFCPDGEEYNSATDSCDLCPIGYYKKNDVDGALSPCVLCPTEFITAMNGTILMSDCNIGNCTPGEYLDPNDNTMCLPCPVGKYSDMKWAEMCTDCPTSRSTAMEGAASQDLCQLHCPVGQESITGSDTCVPCMIGYFKPMEGLIPCTECPTGFITATTESTAESQCDVEDCAAGEYLDGKMCKPCARATYQPDGRQTSCLPCGGDLTTLGEGKTNMSDCVTNCENGFGYDESTSQCMECLQGFYRTKNMEDLCTACAPNLITPAAGSATVAQCTLGNCTAGEHRDDADATMCVPCPRGSYQTFATRWEADCTSCGPDLTTPMEGSMDMSECVKECPDGQQLNSSNLCEPCPRGYYRKASDSFMCEMCPPDKVTPAVGAITAMECTTPNCTTNMYIVEDGCQPCPSGSVQPEWWQTACDETDECATGADNCLAPNLGGFCNNTIGSFNCKCQAGYEGDGVTTCTHKCSLTPLYCQNGGTCTFVDANAPYCICTEYYDGPTCAKRIEPPNDTATLIGGIIGGTIGIILLILGALGVYWCSKSGAPVKKAPPPVAPAPVMPAPMYMPTQYQPTYQPQYIPAPQYDGVGMVQTNRMAGSLSGSLGRNMYVPPGPTGGGAPSVAGYNTVPHNGYMFFEDRDDDHPVDAGRGIRVQVPGQY